MPKVFIIILHYGSLKNTNECLESLKKLDYPNFEILVVDNGAKEKFKNATITNKENLGFAGGNNVGIKYALNRGTDYVLLLNDDTIVDPGFLKELIKTGESDKKNGILGPIGGKINWLHTKGIHTTKNVDYISGVCMLVKRKVIEEIGLMPEEYFLYFEDADWCFKARKRGFKCVLVPTSQIQHKVSQSTVEGSFSYIYYHYRNGLLLSRRNAPFFIRLIAYFVSFLVYAKQLIKRPSKWTKAIKLGIKDFYKGKFGKYENWH